MIASLAMALLVANPDKLFEGFVAPPSSSRMRMYWRIFGPAMSPDEIDYQLDVAKRANLGGLVAYFMYPYAVDDVEKGIRNQPFGSPAFLATFGYAAQAAAKRGLRLGINGGTGWPYGGPSVSVGDSAKKLVELIVKAGQATPKLGPNDRVVAQFVGGHLEPADTKSEAVERHLFIERPTLRQVKRASLGGEGLEVDPWNTAALHRWLDSNVVPLLEATNHGLDTLGCDSLEVYDANWATDLPLEFKKRRGYELIGHLDAAYHDKSAAGDSVRFDYWRTLTELFEERFTQPLGDFSKRHGLALEMEAYGTPPSPMSSARYIQVPTGEHYEWQGLAVQKYVASAAHLAGRTIIGSEAWTWAGLPNRLADSLSDIKLVSDMTFLLGANDLTGVDFPYSPRSAGAPGWIPYYGPTFNQNNPQWLVFADFAAYASRCQWMLRQGKPKVSAAVYVPVEDALATGGMDQMLLDFLIRDHFVTGKATSEFGLRNALTHYSALLRGITRSGIDYDAIDFWALNRQSKVERGSLRAGDSRVRAIVLPFLESMDLPALQRVESFCRAGGLVIAVRHLPKRAAGARASQGAFAEALTRIFGPGKPGSQHRLGMGSGMVVETDDEVGPLLASRLGQQVEFESCPPSVGFVQRETATRKITFLVNTADAPADVAIKLPPDAAPQLWDPLSGAAYTLALESGRAIVPLAARGSAFLVTGIHSGTAPERLPHPLTKTYPWAPDWTITFPIGDEHKVVQATRLTSWTDFDFARFFSGVADYEATVDWTGAGRAEIEIEGLHEVAEVWVNGKRLGSTWSPPYRVAIGPNLHRGLNTIKLRVANLPINGFLGQPDPDLAILRAKYGNRFQAPEEKQIMKEPAPSGITGTVRILTE